MTPQETQNLQNTHALMKSRKRELRPKSSNSPYRIESWLIQLPQNNKQNPWLVTLQDPPDGQGPERTASRSRQSIPDQFYGGNLKAKIFLQQVDNKIADAAGASEGRRIRYMISLLKGSAAEWAATYMNNKEYTTFTKYRDLRKKFLERFTDLNPSGTALAQLL